MRQFFKVPTRVHNALMILCFLAQSDSKWPISLSLISKYLKLSYDYLEQITVSLKKAGLVKSFRGSAGGYKLAKNPKEISLKDVMVAIEGPIQVTDCAVGKKCGISDKCPSIKIWTKLQKELDKSFEKVKLSDI